jgi:hypothetical protein
MPSQHVMVAQRGGDAFETFIGFLGEESRRSSGLLAPTLLRTLDGVHKIIGDLGSAAGRLKMAATHRHMIAATPPRPQNLAPPGS